MSDTKEEIYYTNNGFGNAVGRPYNNTVPLKEFIDFLTEMLNKGGDTLYIVPYQKGEHQTMGIYRQKTKEEIRQEEINELEKRLKELKAKKQDGES